jgi:hypothetical protein
MQTTISNFFYRAAYNGFIIFFGSLICEPVKAIIFASSNIPSLNNFTND